MKQAKRYGFSLTLMGLAVLFSAAAVGAQDFSVELMLNSNDPSDGFASRYDDEWGGGVGLTYMFNDYFGFHTSMNYVKFTADYEGADFGIIRWNINGRIAVPFAERFRLFAEGGMGLYLWDADSTWWTDGESEDGADLGYNWGFGMDFNVWKDIDVTASYTLHSVEFEDSNDRFCWSEISLGARFHLDPMIFSH